MTPRVFPHRCDRECEHGAILLVVLVLTVTFAALSMALLSTAEMSLRVQNNGRDIERAERAAQSGVEWAAAVVKANGLVDGARATTLAPGVVVATAIRSSTSPNLMGGGSAYGIATQYGADVSVLPGAFPHTLLVFNDAMQSNDSITVNGSLYGGATPSGVRFNAARPLEMNGDLQLVAISAPTHVRHTSGTTQLGAAKLTEPTWNTLPYTVTAGWTVPMRVCVGSTTLSKTTFDGILVVNLLANQTLTLDEVTINGTIVVPAVHPPVLDLLGVPEIKIGNHVVVNGGTAETGNLAILAPTATLVGTASAANSIKGVVYVGAIGTLDGFTFTGQVMVRGGITSTGNGVASFDRPAGFEPTVPVGITWTAASSVRLRWRGKQ